MRGVDVDVDVDVDAAYWLYRTAREQTSEEINSALYLQSTRFEFQRFPKTVDRAPSKKG